jgi:acyl-CoA oxidase
MKASLFVAGRYSTRRMVAGSDGNLIPILSFRTQQLPILHTLAQVHVLEAYVKDAVKRFVSPGLDPQVRQGIATTFKAVMIKHVQGSLPVLSERCGAQGLFEHNGIIRHEVCRSIHHFSLLELSPSFSYLKLEMRGAAIAEGDILALSIRELAIYIPYSHRFY